MEEAKTIAIKIEQALRAQSRKDCSLYAHGKIKSFSVKTKYLSPDCVSLMCSKMVHHDGESILLTIPYNVAIRVAEIFNERNDNDESWL